MDIKKGKDDGVPASRGREAALAEVRKAVEDIRQIRKCARLDGEKIRDLVDSGRRY